jgi:hypothetical protein
VKASYAQGDEVSSDMGFPMLHEMSIQFKNISSAHTHPLAPSGCALGYNDFDFFKENYKSGPIDRCKIEF